MVALLPFPSSICFNKEKEEGDGSNVDVAFFAALYQKRVKKVMVALLPSPSSLRYNKRK
jgi:hypothetical protein